MEQSLVYRWSEQDGMPTPCTRVDSLDPYILTSRFLLRSTLIDPLRAVYGPAFTRRKGVTDRLRPGGPSLRPSRGPDMRLPGIVTFHLGDAAARAVIGPLIKT